MTDQSSTGKRGAIPWFTMATIGVCTALLPYGELLSLKPVFLVDAVTVHPEKIGTALLSLVTYMFQHSAFGRFEDNIFFFALCGFFLERAIGSQRFALFVIATAIGAGIVHVLFNPHMTLGVIGLSGVTMGLLAAVAVAGRQLIKVGWLVLAMRALFVAIVISQLYAAFFGKGIVGGDSNSYSLHFGSVICGLSLYVLWLRERLNCTGGDSTGAKTQ